MSLPFESVSLEIISAGAVATSSDLFATDMIGWVGEFLIGGTIEILVANYVVVLSFLHTGV